MSFTHKKDLRVFVAGATGMVGSAICRRLDKSGYKVLTGPKPRVDLRNQQEAYNLLKELEPDWVFLAAAKVGGINANNTYPADFIYDNLMIQTNIMHTSHKIGVQKLMFLGSSCIYPRLAAQPMCEDELLNGQLESTNKPYAIAKISGIIMAQSYNRQYGTKYISVMPTNLYGPNDNFDLENSHVIPAMIRKMHEAKSADAEFMEVWGTGKPKREFLHVDDLADACVFLMERYDSSEIVNIGTGKDLTIRELAELIKEIVGFEGELRFNDSMPDGTPRKLLDVSRLIALGWSPSISLREGLESTYSWYTKNESILKK